MAGQQARGNPEGWYDHEQLSCESLWRHAGLLALGYHHGVDTASKGEPSDLSVAEDLMRTCYEMYRR